VACQIERRRTHGNKRSSVFLFLLVFLFTLQPMTQPICNMLRRSGSSDIKKSSTLRFAISILQ
jgi:hypothetical protein